MDWIYPFFLLALPLGGPLLCFLAHRRGIAAAYAVALGILALAGIFAFQGFLRSLSPVAPEMQLFDLAEESLLIRLDGLGTILALIGSALCFASAVVSGSFGAIREHGLRYLSSILVLCSALNGIFLAGDLLLLALFWELMVVSSYLLIIHHGGSAAEAAGGKYFILTQSGAILLIISVMIAFQQTGTTRIDPGVQFASNGAFGAFALLAFIAFAIDAAIVPVHIWLPDAHSESPTPMSALLSGIVVKTGLYGIIRLFYLTYGLPVGWPDYVVILALVTAFVGVVLALFQMDGKRLIAFHTVSQVGLIAMALGSGEAMGVTGAMYHLVAHSIFKPLLFLSAGWVMWSAGTRNLRKISVQARGLLPFYIIGLLSISGVPPLSGYFGKSLIGKSILSGFPVAALLSTLVGMLTLLSFMKLGWFLFRRERDQSRKVEVPLPVIAVTGALALMCVLLGVLAPLIVTQLDSSIGLSDQSTPVTSPIQASTSNLLSYGGFAVALLIWFRKEMVYRLFTTGALGFAGRLAGRELYLNEALSLVSRAIVQVGRLSSRIATGNAGDYMAYIVVAWLGGVVLIAGGML